MEDTFKAEIAADQVAIAASANKMAISSGDRYASRGRPNHVTRKHFLGQGPRVNCKYCHLSVRNRPGGEMRNHLLKCDRFADLATSREMEIIRSNEKAARINKTSAGRQMPIEALRPTMMGARKVDSSTGFSKSAADKHLAVLMLTSTVPRTFFTNNHFTEFLSLLQPGYTGIGKPLDVYLSELVIQTRDKTISQIEKNKYVTLALNSWPTISGQSIHAVTVFTPTKEEYLLDVILQDGDLSKNAHAIMSMIPLKKVSAIVTSGPGDGKALREVFSREIPWAITCASFSEMLDNLCKRLLSTLEVNQKTSMCGYIAAKVNRGRKSLEVPNILNGTPSTRLTTFVVCMKGILRNRNEIKTRLVNDMQCNQAIQSNMFWDSLSQFVAILEPLKNLAVKTHALFNLSDCSEELLVTCKNIFEEVRSYPSWTSGISEFCSEMVRELKHVVDPSAQLALILDPKYYYVPHHDVVTAAKRALRQLATSLGADSSESDAILYEFDLFVKDPRSASNYWDSAGKEDFPYLSVFVPRILSCGANAMSCQKSLAVKKLAKSMAADETKTDNLALFLKGYLAIFSQEMELRLDADAPVLQGLAGDLVSVPDHLVENVDPLSELSHFFASESALRQFPYTSERMSGVVDIERFKRKFDV